MHVLFTLILLLACPCLFLHFLFPHHSLSSHPLPLPLPLLPLSKAGMYETMITNPMEIVKIRLQVAGEMGEMGEVRASAVHVVKELGFRGLYKVCG